MDDKIILASMPDRINRPATFSAAPRTRSTGLEVVADLVSRVTDAVLAEVSDWRTGSGADVSIVFPLMLFGSKIRMGKPSRSRSKAFKLALVVHS